MHTITQNVAGWTLIVLVMIFGQTLFHKGWKGAINFGRNNTKIETFFFLIHQITWFAFQAFYFYWGGDNGISIVCGFNCFALSFAVLAYSEWMKYIISISALLIIETCATLSALLPLIIPPPVTNWMISILLTLVIILQLPAIIINKIDTADTGNYRMHYLDNLNSQNGDRISMRAVDITTSGRTTPRIEE